MGLSLDTKEELMQRIDKVNELYKEFYKSVLTAQRALNGQYNLSI